MSPESIQGVLTGIERKEKYNPDINMQVLDRIELILDTGITIILPPEAEGLTVQPLQVGDSFSITTPWERVIEGAPQPNENASEIIVMREGQRLLGFVMKSDMVTRTRPNPNGTTKKL